MVLIIDTSKRTAESISDIFYYMGILSKAATPKEALSEISPVYRAVLISNPDTFPDIEDYTKRLSQYAALVPFFSVSDNPNNPLFRHLFTKNYHNSVYSSSLATDIMRIQDEHSRTPIGIYRLAGIDASCDLAHVTALNDVIPFTKTEVMILRYLIVSYPEAQSAKNILKYSFKQNKKPEITSIRTHISLMNKKYRNIMSKNLIISLPEKGYLISTPEILQMISPEKAESRKEQLV